MKSEDRRPDQLRTANESAFKFVSPDDLKFTLIKDHYNKLLGRKQEKETSLREAKKTKKSLEQRYDDSLKARSLIQSVAKTVQSQLQFRISSIVTLAEAAIFPDPYEFEVEFVERRNRTECDLWFVKDGEKMTPVTSSGGGALDVASFALVCAFWSLEKKRPTLIFDEPMKFLSRDLQSKAALMVKELAEKLKLQFIITSHIGELLEAADKQINVEIKDGISKVEDVGASSI